MTKKLYIFILLLALIPITGISQTDMQQNWNQIDTSFIWKKSGLTWEKSSADIILTCRKHNDSIFDIFILNNSKDSIKIYTHNSKLQLIQEAKNIEGKWKPIEYFGDVGCGFDVWFSKLEGNGIIKTSSKAYQGKFKTYIRFKLLFNDKTYYSNSVPGNIDLSQFLLSDKVKQESGYYIYKKFAGEKIAQKVIFLEPNGVKEYLQRNKEYSEEWNRKNKKQ